MVVEYQVIVAHSMICWKLVGDDESPIEAVSASSLSSDYSSTIFSPGTIIFLSICLYSQIACGQAAHVEFGNNLILVCLQRDLYA